jgi:hypothetical protein
MSKEHEKENRLVFSYLALRSVIGALGTLLPFLLALGALILFGTGIQDSVSDYYHTEMGGVFVGMLFAIGFFLLSYKGYEPADSFAGTVAWIAAVGVALCPVGTAVGYLHYIFAALFFLTLTYFSLFLFTKTNPDGKPTRRKLQRNRIYRICGYTMFACIVLVGVYSANLGGIKVSLAPYNPIFWLEAIAIVAFGISWIVKGEALLKDEVTVASA